MKNSWLILGILGIGGLAYYLNNKNKSSKIVDVEKSSAEIKAKDEKKFTNAFLMQYDIVVAPIRVQKKAKMIADDIITSRNEKAQKRLDSYKPSYI